MERRKTSRREEEAKIDLQERAIEKRRQGSDGEILRRDWRAQMERRKTSRREEEGNMNLKERAIENRRKSTDGEKKNIKKGGGTENGFTREGH